MFGRNQMLSHVGFNGVSHGFKKRRNGTFDEAFLCILLVLFFSSQSGAYSVIVSNSSGALVSDAATLQVGSTDLLPKLTVLGRQSKSLDFVLIGPSFRYYLLGTSSDLQHWNFVHEYFHSNSPIRLTITNNAPRQYARVLLDYDYHSYGPSRDLCVVNLRQLLIAKTLFQRASGESYTYTPLRTDLLLFLPHQVAPICPSDRSGFFATSYVLGTYDSYPVCLIQPATHYVSGPDFTLW